MRFRWFPLVSVGFRWTRGVHNWSFASTLSFYFILFYFCIYLCRDVVLHLEELHLAEVGLDKRFELTCHLIDELVCVSVQHLPELARPRPRQNRSPHGLRRKKC